MRIGQLAAETGVTVQTVRYYERRGLLKKSARLSSGYRTYSTDAVRRIRFIKQSKELGYTLVEIASLLELGDTRPHNTAEAREIVSTKISNIDEKIRGLQRMRNQLITLGKACGCGDSQPVCRFLEQIDWQSENEFTPKQSSNKE